MSVLAKCDRCGAEVALDTEPGPGGHFRSVNNVIPDHWEYVAGAMLCEKCSIALHTFLSGKDPCHVNLNQRVWIKRNGKVHPYQLWELMHIYGPMVAMPGTPSTSPFDDNTIYLEEPKP